MSEAAPSKKATAPVLFGFPSTDDLSKSLASFVLAAQDDALTNKKQATFKIAISGGSLPKVLGKDLIGREDVPLDKWCVARSLLCSVDEGDVLVSLVVVPQNGMGD